MINFKFKYLVMMMVFAAMLLVAIESVKTPKKYDDPVYILLKEKYGPNLADRFFDQYEKDGYSLFASEAEIILAKSGKKFNRNTQ